MFSLFSIICIIKQKLLPRLKLSQSTESKILFCLLTLHAQMNLMVFCAEVFYL